MSGEGVVVLSAADIAATENGTTDAVLGGTNGPQHAPIVVPGPGMPGRYRHRQSRSSDYDSEKDPASSPAASSLASDHTASTAEQTSAASSQPQHEQLELDAAYILHRNKGILLSR